jgi:hypothetical protein
LLRIPGDAYPFDDAACGLEGVVVHEWVLERHQLVHDDACWGLGFRVWGDTCQRVCQSVRECVRERERVRERVRERE